MSSIRVKREKHSPDRHRSRTKHRSRSRSRERIRIKQEDSGRQDNRRQDRGYEEPRGRHRTDEGRSRHGGERSRDEADSRVRIKQEREHYDAERRQNRERRQDNNPFANAQVKEEWGRRRPEPSETDEASAAPEEKHKPNFGLSGKLAEDTNTFRGVVIKYNEPPEARVPKRKWRFYIFKGQEELPTLHLHRQSAYLLGRDRKIADVPIDHPSCSKQHAVLQYRLVDIERDDGSRGRRVKPYVIDLESANGTFLNNKQIEAKRYYELQEKDVLKFGFSTREYVMLHAQSKADEDDEDI